jgi:hypothetical protein
MNRINRACAGRLPSPNFSIIRFANPRSHRLDPATTALHRSTIPAVVKSPFEIAAASARPTLFRGPIIKQNGRCSNSSGHA